MALLSTLQKSHVGSEHGWSYGLEPSNPTHVGKGLTKVKVTNPLEWGHGTLASGFPLSKHTKPPTPTFTKSDPWGGYPTNPPKWSDMEFGSNSPTTWNFEMGVSPFDSPWSTCVDRPIPCVSHSLFEKGGKWPSVGKV